MSKGKLLVQHLIKKLQLNLTLLLAVALIVNILDFIQRYLFTEIDLLPYLFLAVMLDCVTGLVRSYRENKLDLSVAFKKPIIKAAEYGCFLLITNMLAHANLFTHGAEKYLGWLPRTSGVYLTLIELRSAMKNLSRNKNIPVDLVTDIINRFLIKSKISKNNTNQN